MKEINITKKGVDSIPLLKEGQKRYRDKKLTGFGIRVGKKTKSYFAEKRVKGKTVRVTIGNHGQVTPEQARKKAQQYLGEMALGSNPLDEKIAKKVTGISMVECYEDFKIARKSLKPKTLYDYDKIFALAFKDWQNKPIIQISKDMVERRHKKLGEESGPAYANLSMRFLRSLLNFAGGKYEDSSGNSLIPINPVKRLSETKGWYKIKRRRTSVKAHDLKDWYHAILEIKNETIRDYLLFVLFTGMRRGEAEKLTFNQVCFKSKSLTITDTKNSFPLELPLSDFLFKLLKQREEKAVSEFVFPGRGATGHLVEPRRQIEKVIQKTGIKFMVHDLRRTFITNGNHLVQGIEVKILTNHTIENDVHEGYHVPDVEQLRSPMQRITNKILKLAEAKPSGKIINLNKKTG